MGCGASSNGKVTAEKEYPRSYSGEGSQTSPVKERNATIDNMNGENSVPEFSQNADDERYVTFDNEDETLFINSISSVLRIMRLRVQTGKMFSKAEMDNIFLLTREVENIKSATKNSQYSVKGTWGILESENMVERFGQQLYDQLLTQNPNLRVYFFGVDLDEQANTIVRMLSLAVRNYDSTEKKSRDMLFKAGARHRGYGVTSKILVEMRGVFFRVFPKFVGNDAFEASKKQWEYFWDEVLKILDEGANSAEGKSYANSYSESNSKLLVSHWELIKSRQAKNTVRHQFVGVMYANAIELNPELGRFQALKDLRFSNRVFESLTFLVNDHRSKKAEEYMKALGMRHNTYNVTPEYLKEFTEPFVAACRKFLVDEWNVTIEARFHYFFNTICEGISKGIIEGEVVNDDVSVQSGETKKETLCFLYTDIEASEKLWAKNAPVMAQAIKQYNRMMRGLIKRYSAFEFSRVENSFAIAGENILETVKLALAIQLELMRLVPIAKGFEMTENTEGRGDPNCWDPRTLRVRISIEYGNESFCSLDESSQSYVYYGNSVSRCASILTVTCGGQILMSERAYDELIKCAAFHDEPCDPFYRHLELPSSVSLQGDNLALDHFVHIEKLGAATNLKGIGYPIELISILPKCLEGRQFVDKLSYRRK